MHQGSLGLKLEEQKGPTVIRLSGPCRELPPCKASPGFSGHLSAWLLGLLGHSGGGGGLSAQPGHTERLTSAQIHAAHWAPVRQAQE